MHRALGHLPNGLKHPRTTLPAERTGRGSAGFGYHPATDPAASPEVGVPPMVSRGWSSPGRRAETRPSDGPARRGWLPPTQCGPNRSQILRRVGHLVEQRYELLLLVIQVGFQLIGQPVEFGSDRRPVPGLAQ